MADEIVKHIKSKTDAQVNSEYTSTEGKKKVYFPSDSYRIYSTGRMMSSRYEADLLWGGRNFSGDFGALDAALLPALGASRCAFLPADRITVQYSTNGGSSWTDYGASAQDKVELFSGIGDGFTIGKNSSSGVNLANLQLRIIINDTKGYLYTVLNKFIIYVGTHSSTGCWCSIDAKTQANLAAGTDTWTNFANKVDISGWSGHNVINTSGFTTCGDASYTYQYAQIRFTFGCTGGTSGTYKGLQVFNIYCFGGVGWQTPSNMAKSGHLYTWDYAKNAVFPANINASGFVKSGSSDSYVLLGGGGHKALSDLRPIKVNGTSVQSTSTIDFINGDGITITEGNPNNGSIKISSDIRKVNITPFTVPSTPTVANYKAALVNALDPNGSHCVGKNVNVSADLIMNWDDDTHTVVSSNVYQMTSIGGYTYSAYGQWLLSTYGNNRVGVVGRTNGSWNSVKWLAYTSDIPTNTNQLTNGAGFITGITSSMVTNALGYTPSQNDTKNTTGATSDTTNKLFLIGAKGQGTNPQTYSNDNCYIGTDGCLYSKGNKVVATADDVKSKLGIENTSTGLFLRKDGQWVIPGIVSISLNGGAYSSGTNGAYALNAIVPSATEQTIESTISSMDKGVLELFRKASGGWSCLGFAGYPNGTKERWGYLGFTGKNTPVYVDANHVAHNLIHAGNIASQSVNYASSAGSVAWANVSGKPSSFTPSAHTHYLIVTEGDNRNNNTTPNSYSNNLVFRGLKYNNKIGSPSTDTYSYLVGLSGWEDSSGGDSHELAFNNSGIYHRHGATTTWGSWTKLATMSDLPDWVKTTSTKIPMSKLPSEVDDVIEIGHVIEKVEGSTHRWLKPDTPASELAKDVVGDEYNLVPDTTQRYFIQGYNSGTSNKKLVEFSSAGAATILSGESGKLYIDTYTNTTYRWNGYLVDILPNTHTHAWSNITGRYDTLLSFSGAAPSLAGIVSPIGMALSQELSANRIAFLNPAAIYCEYSTDGESWTQLNFGDYSKQALVTKTTTLPIGKASTSEEVVVGSKTRVTLTGTNASGTQYFYCSPKKLLIQASTANSMEVLIEYRTGTNTINNGKWATYGTYALSGWSGWNDIPLVLGTLGGGSTRTSNNWQLRLTFVNKSKSTSYPTNSAIYSIRLFADNGWLTPSTMASTGHLYDFNIDKRAFFPEYVSASGFIKTNSSDNYVLLGGGGHKAVSDFTDTKVTQTVTSSSNTSPRPLLIGNSYSDASTFAPATTTASAYATHLAKFAPSTGILSLVGLTKMNTNGTMATGSNSKVWNTNGGVSDLPTVNNATLTIQKNAVTIGTFSANSATNQTVNISVPKPHPNLVKSTVSCGRLQEKWAVTDSYTPNECNIYEVVSAIESDGKLTNVSGKAIYLLDARVISWKGKSIPVSATRDGKTKKWKITIPSDYTSSTITNCYCYVKFVYDNSASGSPSVGS